MHTTRFRLTGPDIGFAAMMSTLEGLPHVDRVEEVGDLMSGMRDDSSSAQLADDDTGGVHDIEVHATSDQASRRVHDAVEERAMELGLAIEFVDEF